MQVLSARARDGGYFSFTTGFFLFFSLLDFLRFYFWFFLFILILGANENVYMIAIGTFLIWYLLSMPPKRGMRKEEKRREKSGTYLLLWVRCYAKCLHTPQRATGNKAGSACDRATLLAWLSIQPLWLWANLSLPLAWPSSSVSMRLTPPSLHSCESIQPQEN